MTYVPLHVHSQYSILDSSLSIRAIVDQAKAYDLPAVAITDFCNMFGVVDFYKQCTAASIKPIIGLEIMVAPGNHKEKKRVHGSAAGYPLVLLAKNNAGYQNLCKLSSIAYLEGFYYFPRVDKELLKQYGKDLICLTGPFYGKVGTLAAGNESEELEEEVTWLQELFGADLYFELANHEMTEEKMRADGVHKEPWLYQKMTDTFAKQKKIIETLVDLGKKKGIGIVATNDIRYLERDDWQAHEVLLNISSGEPCEVWEKDAYGTPKNKIPNPKRQTAYSHELYFKSPEEMAELFRDLPEAITETEKIAEKCDVTFDFSKKFYPVFVSPELEGKKYTTEERLQAAADYLRELCKEGIETRYTSEVLEKVREKFPDKDPLQVVEDRLSYELEIITSKGMCDYLLIVHDFIAWAKSKKIPVGPGRGSGAGSIILYLIGITDIEPLRFDLFFERFINPERLSYPDIDVDICMERRPEVIRYTIDRYGRDNVAQIITFGTMKAKMAIKDVGRVLNVPLAKVNEIAKLVPDDLHITIDKALSVEPELASMYKDDPDTKRVIDYAKRLEGSIRNTGVHAAGIIICGDPLTDHIPVCNAKDSEILVTQFSMKPVETVGMLKIDFLGLKTLTTIQKTADMVKEQTGKDIPWASLKLDDKPTFDLLNHGKTMGIFQLESAGMQDLARQLHIDRFEEIIAVGALYRPGPMEMIPSFIQRKHGTEEIEYDHPWLVDILKETYGIMVYQEQVMQLASTLAGYSLGEGDVLRRAMGKKDLKEMQKQRDKFRDGAIEKGLSEELAMKIFDKVEKFASYGFNKSHATAYGYLSYATAYFKANYPKQWMAALMTCDMLDLSKVAKHIREAQSMHIPILPPNVNESKGHFVATEEGIRFALSAIKGVGEGVVEVIVQNRKEGGPYESIHDFLYRVDSSHVGKKVVQNLILSGSFDWTGWTRKQLEVYLLTHFDTIVKEKKDRAKGIMDLFADSVSGEKADIEPPEVTEEPRLLDVLSTEKELLGFYVTGHPLSSFKELIAELKCTNFEKIESMKDGEILASAFVVDSMTVRLSARTQKRYAIMIISDGMENFDLPVWPDAFEKYGSILHDNALIFGVLQVDKREEKPRLKAHFLMPLAEITEERLPIIQEEMDKAGKTAKNEQKRAKRQKRSEEEMKQIENYFVEIDIDRISMKGVLQLKQIFRKHAGKHPYTLSFLSQGKVVGNIEVEGNSGLDPSEDLQKELALRGYFIKMSKASERETATVLVSS